MSNEPEIRHLRPDDLAGWKPLWEGYTAFYRAELGEEQTAATFARLCEDEGDLIGLLALDGSDTPVGLAHLVMHENTWSSAPSCYLQDLYVDPASRGGAVAHALFAAIYAEARNRGADRVYWHTQQYNGRARSLYDTVGQLTSFIVYEEELG
ncbi:MAG: GNAT family N-acetyltransferase [Actinobacteria bacterium]|nr:GNAT family N-acetyltransferase [Actinomycetota bacterium]